MTGTTHPTPEQIARYRQRVAPPDELIEVDRHIGTCDQCHALVNPGNVAHMVTLVADEHEHLSYEELERYVDGEADDIDRELVRAHTEECEVCRRELADLSSARESLRGTVPPTSRGQRAWLLVAATVAIVVAGAAIVLLFPRAGTPLAPQTVSSPAVPQPPPADALPATLRARVNEVLRTGALKKPDVLAVLAGDSSGVRGTGDAASFSLERPVATAVVDARPQFRWTPLRGATSYSVTIVDNETGAIAATGSTDFNSWPPPHPLPRGRTYAWQVKARRGLREITVPRPPRPEALFRVASDQEAAEVSSWSKAGHLAAGILFAEHGFLDDAERELQLAADAGEARATTLLTEMRSWRALPNRRGALY